MDPMQSVLSVVGRTELSSHGSFAAAIIETYAFPRTASLAKAVQLRSRELVERVAMHTPADKASQLRRFRDFNVALSSAIVDDQLDLANLLVDTFHGVCIRDGALKAVWQGHIGFLQRTAGSYVGGNGC